MNAPRSTRSVGWWLVVVAAAVIVQVMLGGITRLTDSGLSITEWKPILGVIPPTTDEAWSEAFQKYHELSETMDDYPILNECDYSDREYEATLENIADAAWKLKRQFDLPERWESAVYDWLSDHDPSEIEDKDDMGGYPSEESLRAAFDALGYEKEPE